MRTPAAPPGSSSGGTTSAATRQVPGVHRAHRVSVHEVKSALLNLVLWRTQDDNSVCEVRVQQRQQRLLIATADPRGANQRARHVPVPVAISGSASNAVACW